MSEPSVFNRAGRDARRARRERRRALNGAGRPLGVEIGVLRASVVALQVADDGRLRIQHERGQDWETFAVTGVRRGLRPWVIGIGRPDGGRTDWIRLRGPARRQGLDDVGTSFDGYFGMTGGDPSGVYFTLQLIKLPYTLPAGLVGMVQASRARTRLRRALAAGAGTPTA